MITIKKIEPQHDGTVKIFDWSGPQSERKEITLNQEQFTTLQALQPNSIFVQIVPPEK